MKHKKRRVMVIENSIAVTGALKSITRIAYDLGDEFDFYFIVPKGSRGIFWIKDKGFGNVYELNMIEISRRIHSLLLYVPYLLLNAFRLNLLIRKYEIEIIHVNDLYNLLPAVLRIFGNRTPYVCHIRFLPNRFPKRLFDFWFKVHSKYAYQLIAVSNSVLSNLPRHNKLSVIHNELPVEHRYPELTDLSKRAPSYTFLYLSNYIKGKGQDYALEAFAKIHTKLPEWKLRLVGGDMGLSKNAEFKLQLEGKSKSLGISDKTEWVGFTEEVEWEYKHADIVLNFSESESFSITCLEALYFGRPVIATDCGGPVEIIDSGESGIIVPNRDINKMAEAMIRLANNQSMRIRMSILGQKLVRDKFSINNTSLKISEIYKFKTSII